MRETVKLILQGIDNSGNDTLKGVKVITYIVVAIIFGSIFQQMLIGIFTLIEGGTRALTSQVMGMCMNAWWGGMNMTNYFLKPTPGDCDGITTTFFVGASVCFGVGFGSMLLMRNYFYGLNNRSGNFKAILTFIIIILIVTLGRYIAGFSPKNAYWAWPDGIVLIINNIVLLLRLYESADSKKEIKR